MMNLRIRVRVAALAVLSAGSVITTAGPGAGVALAVTPPPVATAPPLYLHLLDPTASESSATDINDQGTIVGWSGSGGFLLSPGAATLTRLAAQPVAINEAGHVLFSSGVLDRATGIELPFPSGFQPRGFNNAGTAAGWQLVLGGYQVPAIVAAGATEVSFPIPVTVIHGAGDIVSPVGVFHAINDAGQMLFEDSRIYSGFATALYDPQSGTAQQLSGVGFGLNNLGQIVGAGPAGFGRSVGVLWDPVDGRVDFGAVFDEPVTWPTAISDTGIIAGYTFGTTGHRAWVMDGRSGPVHELPLGNFPEGESTAVNADGTVVGFVVDADGHRHAAMWNTTPADGVPPVVTGQPIVAANPAGWHSEPVTVDWTATDPAPSSGPPTIPAPTVVATEGASQVVTSGPSCDPAGNCATGTVTVAIDLTAPVVTVTGVTAGATYPYGAVPVAGCATTDALSGVATPAVLTEVRGAGGTYTVTCTGATDVAGQLAGPVVATYQVTITVVSALGATATTMVLASGATNANGQANKLDNDLKTGKVCKFITDANAEVGATLTRAQADELVYWARTLDPTCP